MDRVPMDRWNQERRERFRAASHEREQARGEREESEHERRLREDPEYRWQQENPWRSAPSRRFGWLRFQSLVSLLIFAAVWAMFQWDHPSLEKAKRFVHTALSQETQMDSLYAWYTEHFGSGLFLVPALKRETSEAEKVHAAADHYVTPVSGTIVEPFGSVRSGAGVVMRADAHTVSAMDAGLVLFAGETAESGKTVVIRHADGVETVYGLLGEIHVKADDWVEAGQMIGLVRPSVSGGLVYFAVKKGKSFVDPADVVAL
jgi:stage IV sporulation protein FA